MTSIEWQEPPAPRRSSRDWQAIFAELRANRGKWALVASNVDGSTGYYVAKREADLERQSARNSEGRHDIYMRAVSS